MGILLAVCLSSLSNFCVCCSLQCMLISVLACWSLQFVLSDYWHYVDICLSVQYYMRKCLCHMNAIFPGLSVLNVSASCCIN
jgi:hypothetical protein